MDEWIKDGDLLIAAALIESINRSKRNRPLITLISGRTYELSMPYDEFFRDTFGDPEEDRAIMEYCRNRLKEHPKSPCLGCDHYSKVARGCKFEMPPCDWEG